MNIYEQLETIRQKPVEVRQRLVVILSASLTLVIFLFWALNSTLISRPVKIANNNDQAEVTVINDSWGIRDSLNRIKFGAEKVRNNIVNIFK